MTTNNDKNAVGGWGGFVYFRASLRPAQAGTAFRGGVFARPARKTISACVKQLVRKTIST